MSAAQTPMPVPPGQYPPFAAVTDTDHRAWIIITTALGLSCIFVFSAIKVFLRWRILAIIQSSVVLAACADGLGKSIELIPDDKLVKVQQLYYASMMFFLISLGLSKLSVAFLLLRLTPYQHHRRVFHTIGALITAWTVSSTFALALKCNLSHPWIIVRESCPNMFLRWQIISAFDIGFEVCLVAMTVYLVWGLQSSIEKKVTVVFAFGMRLPLIITIAFRLANFNSGGFTTNPTLLQAKFLAWTQTELSYSIMAATIPSLRSFIKSLATNYGSTTVDGYGSTYGSGYANNGAEGDMQSGSYQMHSFRPKGKGDEYKYRIWTTKADNSGKSTEVNKTDTGSMASSESQRMIIQKNLVWEVVVDPK